MSAEWDQRQLCPDGGCVGVIGPDGTCKTCGRAAPNWGDERTRGLSAEPADAAADVEDAEDEDEDEGEDEGDRDGDGADADDPDDDDDDDDDDEDEGDDEPGIQRTAAPAAPAKDWQRRRLCPDGGCIGVIGADGTCPVCGKVA